MWCRYRNIVTITALAVGIAAMLPGASLVSTVFAQDGHRVPGSAVFTDPVCGGLTFSSPSQPHLYVSTLFVI
jgi:hypothetical protein